MNIKECIEIIEYKLSQIEFVKLYKSPNDVGKYSISVNFNIDDYLHIFNSDHIYIMILHNLIKEVFQCIIKDMKKTKNYSFIDLRNDKNPKLLIDELYNNIKYKNILIPEWLKEKINIEPKATINSNIIYLMCNSYNKNIYINPDDFYNNEIFLFNDIGLSINKLDVMNNGYGLKIILKFDYKIHNDKIYILDDEHVIGLDLYRDYMVGKLL
ncbi:MAG: hypothetical protein M0R46_13565 [Candidatus Muirbacterium halophilum]|nr:hypothetical protein [Candidatus Muirbacterium halophilum]